jgi:RNA polymerase sigma factor (sigma-70 family)
MADPNDSAAWREIGDFLMWAGSKTLADRDLLWDVVAETQLAVRAALPTAQGPDKFGGLVTVIFSRMRAAAMKLRADERQRRTSLESAGIQERVVEVELEEPGEDARRLEALSECLQQLKPRERQIVVGRYTDRGKRPYSELAAELGVTAENARQIQDRTLNRLKTCMQRRLEPQGLAS